MVVGQIIWSMIIVSIKLFCSTNWKTRISNIQGNSLSYENSFIFISYVWADYKKSLIYQFSKYFVFFLVPAYVEPQPTDGKFVVRKGSTITLSCRATGNPLPTVTWQRKVRKNWIKTQ